MGIVRAESEGEARVIASKHLHCDVSEVTAEAIELQEDGFCEIYYA